MKAIRMMKGWMTKLMGLPSCEEIEQFAYRYLERELDSELREKFEKHLRSCINCERFVRTYREVALPENLKKEIPLDPDFMRRVAEFLKNNSWRRHETCE